MRSTFKTTAVELNEVRYMACVSSLDDSRIYITLQISLYKKIKLVRCNENDPAIVSMRWFENFLKYIVVSERLYASAAPTPLGWKIVSDQPMAVFSARHIFVVCLLLRVHMFFETISNEVFIKQPHFVHLQQLYLSVIEHLSCYHQNTRITLTTLENGVNTSILRIITLNQNAVLLPYCVIAY
uniref:Uncharacterized protein n=1 Tax=Wuchereria bancrofti TaxID=6293 RepID=A0AAF5RT84_WUCBA